MSHSLLAKVEASARDAAELFRNALPDQAGIASKEGHANFVTVYDEKVQKHLIQALSCILPEANFVGEEDGKEVFLPEYRKGYTFVIDPIDGTSNFMKGYRPSVTSIALLKDGVPYIGVICNPYTQETYSAMRGEGAFCNGTAIHSSQSPLSLSLVSMGTAPYYEDFVSRGALDLGYYYLQKSIDIRRSGSAAHDLCTVANGSSGLFFEPRLGLWDYAAGACIVMEAGGTVTDFYGHPLPFDGPSSLVAAGAGVAKEDYLPPKEMIFLSKRP